MTYTLPAGGTVTQAGIVNDGGSPGSVTVTDVQIGDHDGSFDRDRHSQVGVTAT